MGFHGEVFRNIGQRQSALRLANLRRLRSGSDFRCARPLCELPFGVELSETVFALDATTMDLCLALFSWGKFRRHKIAVKLRTVQDLRGLIPTNVYVTAARFAMSIFWTSCLAKLEHFT